VVVVTAALWMGLTCAAIHVVEIQLAEREAHLIVEMDRASTDRHLWRAYRDELDVVLTQLDAIDDAKKQKGCR